MNDSEHNITYDMHPLQSFVEQLISATGKIIAFTLLGLMILSIALVVSSAFALHAAVGAATLFLVGFAALLIGYIYSLGRKSPLIIVRNGQKTILDSFTPIYLLLILCGFVQILFWVLDPCSPNHEPRSVFIIAVAGAFAYFRQQYRQATASQHVN
jgi:hypothetical protein